MHSQIILALLAPGEAYIVDMRKQRRSRDELCEVQDDNESDEEGQSRSRCVSRSCCEILCGCSLLDKLNL